MEIKYYLIILHLSNNTFVHIFETMLVVINNVYLTYEYKSNIQTYIYIYTQVTKMLFSFGLIGGAHQEGH